MVDSLTPEQRSERMACVRGKDSKPELWVRRLVHKLGYRYRLHLRNLPGQPDMTFANKKKVIFVHGCFWHRHDCPAGRRLPKSRLDFWEQKLNKNKTRDEENLSRLSTEGWGSLIIWECETGKTKAIEEKIRDFLDA